tara:strand:- start:165 stop:641 length:477 start_codon:yes stop_codon:yes gene_type:complete
MRYKKYRYGGKKVPGMYAQDGTEVNPVPPQMQSLNERPMMNVENSSMGGLSPQQIQMMKMQALQQQQKIQQQQKMMEMMQQMKLQNDSLLQQNELLKTQISKTDLINSARTTKQTPGATTSPKKRGGRVKFPSNGFAGNAMKMGGSCLPGGAHKKRRR